MMFTLDTIDDVMQSALGGGNGVELSNDKRLPRLPVSFNHGVQNLDTCFAGG